MVVSLKDNKFLNSVKEKFKKYKKEIIIFLVHIFGVVFIGFLIFKLSIFSISQVYYRDPIKDYILHSKFSYKLAISLSEDNDLKNYLNKGELTALKTFLSQFLLPGDNIRIEVFNPNFIKLIDLPASETESNNLFKVSKDPCLPKVLSAGIGGFFFKPGEYGFEFSGISPIYYQNQIIGLIEIKQIYDKPVIVPKRYKEYIKYAPIKEVGKYILINANYPQKFVEKLIKERRLFEKGKYYILRQYKDYYFIFELDFTKFLIIFLTTYSAFSVLYLILVWKYIFEKRTENINTFIISKKLSFVPHIVFDKDGQILAINPEKWEPYVGPIGKIKNILSFIKALKVRNPLNFYEAYFKNLENFQEVSLKLRDKYVRFKILPISNNLAILILEDLTGVYRRIKKLKKEKDHLEDLVNDLKVLLKTKNNKIAELKLQLYFLKQKENNKKENNNSETEND